MVRQGVGDARVLRSFEEEMLPYFRAMAEKLERIAADPEAFYRGEIPTPDEEEELAELRGRWLRHVDVVARL